MAIIRYPLSREELHRSVLFDMITASGTLEKFSASEQFNKQTLFIFDIIVLVYHRYQYIHSD